MEIVSFTEGFRWGAIEAAHDFYSEAHGLDCLNFVKLMRDLLPTPASPSFLAGIKAYEHMTSQRTCSPDVWNCGYSVPFWILVHNGGSGVSATVRKAGVYFSEHQERLVEDNPKATVNVWITGFFRGWKDTRVYLSNVVFFLDRRYTGPNREDLLAYNTSLLERCLVCNMQIHENPLAPPEEYYEALWMTGFKSKSTSSEIW